MVRYQPGKTGQSSKEPSTSLKGITLAFNRGKIYLFLLDLRKVISNNSWIIKITKNSEVIGSGTFWKTHSEKFFACEKIESPKAIPVFCVRPSLPSIQLQAVR